jgi:hypothetical protein
MTFAGEDLILKNIRSSDRMADHLDELRAKAQHHRARAEEVRAEAEAAKPKYRRNQKLAFAAQLDSLADGCETEATQIASSRSPERR